jgi:hypothetical protein
VRRRVLVGEGRGESGEVAYRGDWQSGRFLYRRTLRWCEDRQTGLLTGFFLGRCERFLIWAD